MKPILLGAWVWITPDWAYSHHCESAMRGLGRTPSTGLLGGDAGLGLGLMGVAGVQGPFYPQHANWPSLRMLLAPHRDRGYLLLLWAWTPSKRLVVGQCHLQEASHCLTAECGLQGYAIIPQPLPIGTLLKSVEGACPQAWASARVTPILKCPALSSLHIFQGLSPPSPPSLLLCTGVALWPSRRLCHTPLDSWSFLVNFTAVGLDCAIRGFWRVEAPPAWLPRDSEWEV